eukprot:6464028-Amphidinium_carterae.2
MVNLVRKLPPTGPGSIRIQRAVRSSTLVSQNINLPIAVQIGGGNHAAIHNRLRLVGFHPPDREQDKLGPLFKCLVSSFGVPLSCLQGLHSLHNPFAVTDFLSGLARSWGSHNSEKLSSVHRLLDSREQ